MLKKVYLCHKNSDDMKYLLTAICAVLLLASCEKFVDMRGPAIYPKARRTVMVYISAENNLSSFVTGDIREMANGSEQLPEGTNLVAFVDDRNNGRPPYIVRFNNGEVETDMYYDNETDFCAADPERMYEILSWMMTRYPADSYGLVLWGHAGGWLIERDSVPSTRATGGPQKAYGVDNGTDLDDGDGKRWMNIPSMARALERLPHKLLFIFADCCNFQCAEVAYELRHATDYIIASPAEIPNIGAPYDKIVPHMFGTADDFYRGIVDEYHEMMTGSQNKVPLSVVRTDAMEELAQATDQLAEQLYEQGEPGTDGMIYYRLTRQYGSVKLMFDMNDMMLRNIDDGEAYSRWKEAYDKAVVYRAMSDRWMTDGLVWFDFDVTEERFGGMSMFVPLQIYDANNYDYNRTIQQMSWYWAAGVYKCNNEYIKN